MHVYDNTIGNHTIIPNDITTTISATQFTHIYTNNNTTPVVNIQNLTDLVFASNEILLADLKIDTIAKTIQGETYSRNNTNMYFTKTFVKWIDNTNIWKTISFEYAGVASGSIYIKRIG